MARAMRYGTIDDRHWMETCKTVCFQCKKMKSFFDKSCKQYPRRHGIPPEVWNNEKVCPHWEKSSED